MPQSNIEQKIRGHLANVQAYTPVDPPELLAQQAGIPESEIIKLNGNENPYGPSPAAADAVANVPLHIYPDPLTPPHDFGQARYVREDMLAPYEFVMEDQRFKGFKERGKIKPLADAETADRILDDVRDSNPAADEEESKAIRDARIDGKDADQRAYDSASAGSQSRPKCILGLFIITMF
jgi:hypothetical protein